MTRTEYQIIIDGAHVASVAQRPKANEAHRPATADALALFESCKHLRQPFGNTRCQTFTHYA